MKNRSLFLLLPASLLASCTGGNQPQTTNEESSIASSMTSWVESLSSTEESSDKELSSEEISLTSEGEEPVISSQTSEEVSYWKSLDPREYGETFRQSIQSLINKTGNKTIGYSANNAVLAQSDKALNGKEGIIPFYHPDTCATTSWNKEHVWPNSRGAGKSGPGSDPQMLRPTASSCNSARGNKFYGVNGNEFDPARCSADSKGGDPYPLYEAARGEAARIIFYVAARYGNGSKMTLSNNPEDSQTLCTMGTLKYLYEWNNKYPVTAQEIRRNNYLHSQGFARNPFIDNRDLVNYIWDENGLRNTPYEGGSIIDVPTSSESIAVSEDISSEAIQSSAPITQGMTIDSWAFLPGAYPKDSEAVVTFNGIRFGCLNVATFDSGKTLQLKKDEGYFRNLDPIQFDYLALSLSAGETPLVYAGTDDAETKIEPENSRFYLQNARYFKIKSNGIGMVKVNSLTLGLAERSN